MKSVLLIYNAVSGKGEIAKNLSGVIDVLSANDYLINIYSTQRNDDFCIEVSKRITDDVDLVICAGGDGTLNNIISALIQTSHSIPVGYIPCGSTNDFARSLKLSNDAIEATKTIVCGKEMKCDIGCLDGKYFTYVAAFGAFTEIAYSTNQHLKNQLGYNAYLLNSLKGLVNIKKVYLSVFLDDELIEGDFILGVISNSVSIGGIERITGNEIDLQDGVFELTLVKKIDTIYDFNNVLIALVSGKESDFVIRRKIKHLVIKCEKEIPWTLDGEYGGEHKEVIFDVLSGAFSIVVP